MQSVTGPEVIFAGRTMLLPIGRVKTVQLLTRETPDFIAPTLWPANSANINSIDYRILGVAAGACVPQPDSRRLSAEVASDRKVGTFQPDDQR